MRPKTLSRSSLSFGVTPGHSSVLRLEVLSTEREGRAGTSGRGCDCRVVTVKDSLFVGGSRRLFGSDWGPRRSGPEVALGPSPCLRRSPLGRTGTRELGPPSSVLTLPTSSAGGSAGGVWESNHGYPEEPHPDRCPVLPPPSPERWFTPTHVGEHLLPLT